MPRPKALHGIARYPFEPIAAQHLVVLHVANGWFDNASALGHRLEATRQAASLA